MKKKGNISDVLFTMAAILYYWFRDKNSDFSTIADIVVLGGLIMIAGKYIIAAGKKE